MPRTLILSHVFSILLLTGHSAHAQCELGDPYWLPVGGGTDSIVRALAVYDDGAGFGPKIYAGGTFQIPADYIARWNGSTWEDVGGGLNDWIRALETYTPAGGTELLFAGGELQPAPGGLLDQAAFVFDGSQWLGFTLPIVGTVHALDVVDLGAGPRLLAGGDFAFSDDGETLWFNLAMYADSQENWEPFFFADGDGGTGVPEPPAPIYAIESWDAGDGPALYVGGAFDAVGSIPAWAIAGWDPDTESWFDLTLGLLNDDGDPAVVHAIEAVEVAGVPSLYVGGSFDGAFGVFSHGVIRWDGANWISVGGGIPEEYRPANIRALEVFDDGGGPVLFVAGFFNGGGGGFGDPGILAWDGFQWFEVDGGVGGSISALAVNPYGDRDALYAGGSFFGAGGTDAIDIATWGWAHGPDEAHYVFDVDGQWNEPANWSTFPQLPGPDTDVCVDVPAGVTITTGEYDTTIRSIHSNGHLLIDGVHPSWEFIVEEASELDTLHLTGGTFEPHAEVLIDRLLWTGGRLYDPTFDPEVEGYIYVQDTLDIFGDEEKVLRTNLFIEQDAFWSNQGDIDVGKISGEGPSSIMLASTAELMIQTDADMTYDLGAIGHIPFTNDGSITKIAGFDDGLTQLRVDFTNAGEVFVDSGTLELFGYGTYTGEIHVAPEAQLRLTGAQAPEHVFKDGSLLHAEGDLVIEGNTNTEVVLEPGAVFNLQGALSIGGVGPVVTLDEDLTVPSLVLSAELTGTAPGIGGSATLTVTESLLWTGSVLRVEGGVTSRGSLEISGPNVKRLWQPLINEGAAQWLEGDLDVRNSGVAYEGGITNAPEATFDIMVDAVLDSPGGHFVFVDNQGTLRKHAGDGDGVTRLECALTNSGTAEIVSGALHVLHGNGGYTQTAGTTILTGGDLRSDDPLRPIRLEGGSLTGAQTVIGVVENSGGEVQPGLGGIGTLTIDGDYTQTAGGTLSIEISDAVMPGSLHDLLAVTGAAALDGTLEVTILGGPPDLGTQFTILTAGGVSGTFDAVTGGGEYAVEYNDDSVVLTLISLPIPGDIDGDGSVGFSDLLIVLSTWGACPAPPADCPADLDGDGFVGFSDLLLVLSAWSG